MATKGMSKLPYGGVLFDVTWERQDFIADPVVTGLLIGSQWLDPRRILLPWAQVLLNTAMRRKLDGHPT